MSSNVQINDFTVSPVQIGEETLSVYRIGSGPDLVLMHELPGMTPQCVTLARMLAGAGFAIHMPLFFGKPGDDSPIMFAAQICLRRQMFLFANGGGSPIVKWLRAYCSRIINRNGGKGVGVIGMCLSGNFAISLLAEASVLASVSCQPALPLGFRKASRSSLGVTKVDLDRAKRRNAAGNSLFCLRFTNDCLSPPERFAAIKECFKTNFHELQIDFSPGNPHGISPRAHAVLTRDFCARTGIPLALHSTMSLNS